MRLKGGGAGSGRCIAASAWLVEPAMLVKDDVRVVKEGREVVG